MEGTAFLCVQNCPDQSWKFLFPKSANWLTFSCPVTEPAFGYHPLTTFLSYAIFIDTLAWKNACIIFDLGFID
jgi:hypothetical protein